VKKVISLSLGLVGLAFPPLALAQPAPAPAARTISLSEAISLAVKQNRSLRSADADIQIAVANEYGARGNEDLLLDADANVTARRSAPLESSQFQQLEFINLHTEAMATKPLFYGGRIGLRASHDYTRTKTRINVSGAPMVIESTTDEFSPTVQVTYFMPLLRGLGEDTMRSQRRRTAAQTEIAVLEREDLVANVVRDIVLAYWDLAYAAQEVEIRRASLDLAREQLRITQARLDVGVGSPTDVAAVRQGIATRESEVLVAELAVAERAIDLRSISGMPITPSEIDLVAADRLDVKAEEIDFQQSLQSAFDRNPQIATLRARGKAATIEIDIAENALRPQLDLNARFGPSGNAEQFGEAIERMTTFKDYQGFAGLTFQMPVGNHTAEGARRAAVAQRLKVTVTEEDLRALIAVSVAKQVNLVRSTAKQIQVNAEAVSLAQVNLDAEKARFEVGRTTNFEVLRRQDELAQSRLRQTRAAADYKKAIAGLQTLTGDLLPLHNIVVRPGGGGGPADTGVQPMPAPTEGRPPAQPPAQPGSIPTPK
jgi:outer membrane protein TolC